MTLSRREFLLSASVAAFQVSCSGIPSPTCSRVQTPTCPAPAPLPIGLQSERCELFAFDEVHRATPTVYRPESVDQIAELLLSAKGSKRSITFRGGGQSLDSQSLNDDVVIMINHENFSKVGDPQRDENGFYMTTGAGACWLKVLEKLAPLGLMPPSLVTAAKATVGGSLSADGVSRASPVVGKEGNQIRSFRMVLANGDKVACERDDPNPELRKLFNAVIGGFGYLGAVTEVTFDLMVARSNPNEIGSPARVFTRSTRHGPTVDWDVVLRSLQSKSQLQHQRFLANRAQKSDGTSAALPRAPEWTGLSVVSFLNGPGMTANLLEQRYIDNEPLRPIPAGVYDKDAAFPAAAEGLVPIWPTLVELGVELGFPEGEFIDELFGWTFFLQWSADRAKDNAHKRGSRLNFTQQTFALPAGETNIDTRPMRRFIELLEARTHAADVRPADIDFLYIPKDDFLMSASNGLTSFVVTISVAELNRAAFSPEITDMMHELSRDCLKLGGRVHLVKGVMAERSDLRAMYGQAAAEFLALKAKYDPDNLFRNEFFERVFKA